jgi:GNAT superfamily N-acetyltransferase
MNIEIKPITPADISSLLSLMQEFAEYEGLADHLKATEQRLSEAMFADKAYVQGLLVTDDRQPVGYALFYPSFSSFRAERGIYLEDLYIRASHRQAGIGRGVLKEIAALAFAQGLCRIDFLVLDWNETAIDFYKRLGAEANAEERHFRFVDEAFRCLLS